MTTGTYTTQPNFQYANNAQHGDTVPTVVVTNGGTFQIAVHAGTWGGGSLDFKILLPDGATYLSILTAVFSADGVKNVVLGPGTYQFVITTTDGLYWSLARVGAT